jgi:hypothetical protein
VVLETDGLDVGFTFTELEWACLPPINSEPAAATRGGGVDRIETAQRAAVTARHVLDGLK